MSNTVVGILAHVDAGKTTLSEAMLYTCGAIRKLGRVDSKDAFLDTYALERERGITIFSKQAELTIEDKSITLLDTPGHVDFSTEMERTLQVLDYAILVISGADGVQGHTLTLWNLLKKYNVPVFLFINKMDQPDTDREALLDELKRSLSDNCMAFEEDMTDTFYEEVAMANEQVMAEYLETGSIDEEPIAQSIVNREIFPCYFGSALKLQGVELFLQGIKKYSRLPKYKSQFGAKVYKISRDEMGNRLTHMKLTGGSLKVKDSLGEEKINQIRIYSGNRFQAVNEAEAGSVVAVTGLANTYPGQGLGLEKDGILPTLAPVMNYSLIFPPHVDVLVMEKKMKELEEEDPQLHITYNERHKALEVQIMGEVQLDVLRRLMMDRFAQPVEFGAGNIVYKETIADVVEGVGHYEPLRHYAEVHLLLEPSERGSGLIFEADCSLDELDRNWQRLILTHLEEKSHKGVLTGSSITDMKITLLSGRAHLKHTEGGDFRQATYRAVRQGLMKARSVLLEPVYKYTLTLPSSLVGRAMTDIENMHGTFEPPMQQGEVATLEGEVPVATMHGYHQVLASYTGGKGQLQCVLNGYKECHNAEEVIAKMNYIPEEDVENSADSVFTSHGAGLLIPWYEVEEHMHLPLRDLTPTLTEERLEEERLRLEAAYQRNQMKTSSGASTGPSDSWATEKELKAIFEQTYGPVKTKLPQAFVKKEERLPKVEYNYKPKEKLPEYLLVDGYNVIMAWPELKELSEVSLDGARLKLQDALCNYQGYKNNTVIVVYDAYKVVGHQTEYESYKNIYTVFTKESETADQYIEKVSHEIGRKYDVTVATSDALEQVIIRGQGCKLLSSRDLLVELQMTSKEIEEKYLEKSANIRTSLQGELDSLKYKVDEK